ncbi:MAG TPA: NAD(P)H-binding protein [Gaiellaceae bacterium]|jgi:NADH dehydrogenase|nr:NAD(P)H-binding protein [Gaiellaceae bacterium]
MILVCGATGQLGGAVAARLLDRGAHVRVLLRPSADAAPLAQRGAEIARGDFRDPRSLHDAVADTDTVVTSVTAIGRALAGENISLDAVDRKGTLALTDAAEQAGVERLVYVSAAGMENAARFPLSRAKLAVERRLRASSLREVIVKPDAFQEVWISPLARLDWQQGRLEVLGRGETKTAYVSVGDVAEAIVRLTLADDPPREVTFGGPERLTRNEVCDLIEQAAGRQLERRHVPRAILHVTSRALGPVKPALASLLGLGLMMDTHESSWDDVPLRTLGIDPRPASIYVRAAVAASG